MMRSELKFSETRSGWMLEGASPNRLRDLLEEFGQVAAAAGAPVFELAPGLPEDDVTGTLRDAGLPCPGELVVWFGWHNGHSAEKPGAASSLPQMIASSLSSAINYGLVPTSNGSPPMMLLTEEPWGLAIELSVENDTPPVRFLSEGEDPDAESRHLFRGLSLCTVVAWWLIGTGQGGYVWDGGQWQVTDVALLADSQRSAHFY